MFTKTTKLTDIYLTWDRFASKRRHNHIKSRKFVMMTEITLRFYLINTDPTLTFLGMASATFALQTRGSNNVSYCQLQRIALPSCNNKSPWRQ